MCSVVPMKTKTQESGIGNDFLCLRREKEEWCKRSLKKKKKKKNHCIVYLRNTFGSASPAHPNNKNSSGTKTIRLLHYATKQTDVPCVRDHPSDLCRTINIVSRTPFILYMYVYIYIRYSGVNLKVSGARISSILAPKRHIINILCHVRRRRRNDKCTVIIPRKQQNGRKKRRGHCYTLGKSHFIVTFFLFLF